jgi:hypothetical protein
MGASKISFIGKLDRAFAVCATLCISFFAHTADAVFKQRGGPIKVPWDAQQHQRVLV